MSPRPATARRDAVATPVVVGACLYAAAMAAALWLLLRPVFVPLGAGLHRFDLVMVGGLGIGAGAVVVALLARRGPALVAMLLAVGYLAGAVVLAIPGSLRGGLEGVLRAVGASVRAPIAGWKDVVTLPVPLGSYEATLAVPLALVAAMAAGVVWSGTRARWWGLSAAVGGAALAVGIVIGPAVRREIAELMGTYGPMSAEILVGLVALGATLAWMLWRMGHERRVALGAAGGGVRGAVAQGRAVGRGVLAAAVLAGATLFATSVAVPVSDAQPREVGRTAVEPRLVVDRAVSPLSSYRAFLSDELYDVPLFVVAEVSGPLERIRIATLPFFDGSEFTAVAPEGFTPLRFQRVPSALPVGAVEVGVRLTVDALEGPWAPLPGELGGAEFEGPRAAALVDSFYYAPEAAAAVIAVDGGVAAGDTLVVTAAGPVETPLAAAGPSPGASGVSSDLIPQSLRDWVDEQQVTRDGEGLATLVSRLRARGFLSHGLTVDGNPRWLTDLGDYSFEPSPAGHSYDRIDRLFTALLEREDEVGSDAATADLVAAVGDDEQFAAATALLAAELGFPARVVVGARLAATDTAGWTPPVCDGVCRGRNMSAWTEVLSASGEWIPVDVTPQSENPVTPAVANQRDPQLPTATDPQQAEPIDAFAALKGRSGGGDVAPVEDGSGAWFTGWVRTAVVGAAVLALLLGPVIAVLVAKASRRSRRRRGGSTAATQGGWDEYVDVGVDAGLAPMPLATRQELAAAYATTHGAALATLADRATFTREGVGPDDARRAWDMVATDRAELLGRRGWWRRLATRLSIRSLLGRETASRGVDRRGPEHPDERWRTVPPRTASSRSRRRR